VHSLIYLLSLLPRNWIIATIAALLLIGVFLYLLFQDKPMTRKRKEYLEKELQYTQNQICAISGEMVEYGFLVAKIHKEARDHGSSDEMRRHQGRAQNITHNAALLQDLFAKEEKLKKKLQIA
jgi:hypothetical protein